MSRPYPVALERWKKTSVASSDTSTSNLANDRPAPLTAVDLLRSTHTETYS
jgi:hypothetical protein